MMGNVTSSDDQRKSEIQTGLFTAFVNPSLNLNKIFAFTGAALDTAAPDVASSTPDTFADFPGLREGSAALLPKKESIRPPPLPDVDTSLDFLPSSDTVLTPMASDVLFKGMDSDWGASDTEAAWECFFCTARTMAF